MYIYSAKLKLTTESNIEALKQLLSKEIEAFSIANNNYNSTEQVKIEIEKNILTLSVNDFAFFDNDIRSTFDEFKDLVFNIAKQHSQSFEFSYSSNDEEYELHTTLSHEIVNGELIMKEFTKEESDNVRRKTLIELLDIEGMTIEKLKATLNQQWIELTNKDFGFKK